MSSNHLEQMKCPVCQYYSPMTMWNFVDGVSNPELKEKLLNGEIYDWKCEVCGHEAKVPFGTIYVDYQNRFMFFYYPVESEVEQEPILVAHYYRHTLGDFIVWPHKMSFSGLMKDYKMRGYIDRLIEAIYSVVIDSPKKNMDMAAIWYQNRNMLKNYQGKEGFVKLIKNQILDEFLDFNGEPVIAFEGISNNSRDYDLRKLPDALTTYHDVMVPLVKKEERKCWRFSKENYP